MNNTTSHDENMCPDALEEVRGVQCAVASELAEPPRRPDSTGNNRAPRTAYPIPEPVPLTGGRACRMMGHSPRVDSLVRGDVVNRITMVAVAAHTYARTMPAMGLGQHTCTAYVA